jgi:hypothetical protein
MISRLIAVVYVGISTASCNSIAADGAMRISGEAVDQTGQHFEHCKLALYSESGDALQTSQVSGEFVETFVIEPRSRIYYVRTTCVGAKSDAKSATFQAGMREQYEKPIDLGRMMLPR